MSDYLQRLVGRTRPATEALRPARVPRPADLSGGDAVGTLEETAEATAGAATIPSTSAMPRERDTAPPALPEAGVSAAEGTTAAVAPRRELADTHPRSPAPASFPIAPPPLPLTRAVVHGPQPVRSPDPEELARLPEDRRSPLTRVHRNAPAAAMRPLFERSLAPEAHPSVTVPEAIPLPPAGVRRDATLPPPALEPRSSAPENQPSPPTETRVSIGRVTVEVVEAPREAPRKRELPPRPRAADGSRGAGVRDDGGFLKLRLGLDQM